MKLNLNFTKYIGKTLLKDWWPVVLGHMKDIQEAINTNDTALAAEVSERKAADTALGTRIDGKADAVHKHVKSDITDFAHTHVKKDITDFPAAMPPTDASVTLDKLAPDVTAAIEGATGLDRLNSLITAVYGPGAGEVQTEPFELTFTCSSFNTDLGHPQGLWFCDDVSVIYEKIKVNGKPIVMKGKSPVRSISVKDDYLENNDWEIVLHINRNAGNGEAVNAVMSYEANEIYEYGQSDYPKVLSVDENEMQLALGFITLPDADVVVGGSPLVLSVPGKTVEYPDPDIVETRNDRLATADKDSILAAVNELAEKCGGAADLKKEVEGLTSRLDAHKHVRSDITDFPETMTPSEHTHTVSEITDFPETMTPADGSVNMAKLADDVKAAINKGGSGVESLTEQLAELKTAVKYLQDNVLYRFDGVE